MISKHRNHFQHSLLAKMIIIKGVGMIDILKSKENKKSNYLLQGLNREIQI